MAGIIQQAVRVLSPGGYLYDGSGGTNRAGYQWWVDEKYLEAVADPLFFRRTAKPWEGAQTGPFASGAGEAVAAGAAALGSWNSSSSSAADGLGGAVAAGAGG